MARYNNSGWHRQSVRHSKARKYGKAGGRYANERTNWYATRKEYHDIGHSLPNNIKGGIADNINPKYFNQKQLAKGIKVEMEHTNKPELAREIAQDHILEDKLYYSKLEKIEGTPKPIKIKVEKKQVIRAKNQLETDLSKAIKETTDIKKKYLLEHMYRELRKADNHTKIQRYMKEYGYALSTLGMALPFYLATPLMTAGVIIGATMTGDVPMTALAPRLAVPVAGFAISTEAVKHSIRTIKAIKQREKEIIKEKSVELRKDTNIPEKEIKIIAKRIAQKELSQTTIIHELK